MKILSVRDRNLTLAVTAVAALTLFAGACGKKQIPTPPPPVAPTAQTPNTPSANPPGFPTATLTAEPSRIEAGQSATLHWTTTNANDVSISGGVGTVAATGSQQVSPIDTTTYTLTAAGPNGRTTATATVTITAPPPPPVEARPTSTMGTLESRVESDLKDAYFDYDSVSIREDAHAALLADADALKRIFNDFPNATINVEGHCDERGSAEYNLGLGDRRASAARDVLVQLGVPEAKLRTISYGKERPQCTEADEACYQKNRRVHLSAGQ
ncbi:MAG TPA: OmpA family protein [Bryobacteraceae bacterium]|nr:OmpA family protein [Bryobacteraceae bacterium]